MSKVKNKFFVFILILGIICSSFVFSACTWGGNLGGTNNENYSSNIDNNVKPIKTEFPDEQIWQKINSANAKISDAIFYSNVHLQISQTITDYFYDEGVEETLTTSITTEKFLSINSAYEKTYYADDDQLAEYWYIPNVQQKPGESKEDALLSSNSYNEYYKSTIGDKSTYYNPKTIKQMWVITSEEVDDSSSDLQIYVNKKPTDSNNHSTPLISGFLNEQIAEFYTGFGETSTTLTMQQLSDYSFKISISFKEEEFDEQFDPDTGEEVEVLLGTTFYSYDFRLDKNGRLVSSEYSIKYEMLFENEDEENVIQDATNDGLIYEYGESTKIGKIVSSVKTKIDVGYNKSDMPTFSKEKWN